MRAYDLTVTGSLIVTGSILNADGTSFLTGSNAGASASFSTRTTTLETSGSITESSASYSTRVTLLEGSGSITESSASYSTRVTTEEGNVDALQTDSGSFSTRVNLLEGSGSITESSASFSTRVTTAEASGALFDGTGAVTFATVDTGQGANELYDMDQNVKTDSNVTFGNVTATGTVTAEEFHTEFVSASIHYVSGSTKFGDTSDDVHSFTGSVHLVNSGSVSGSVFSTGSFGSLVSPGSLTLGTITTGVWNGTAIASAYLDADTAHLSTTQTFSGAKTFSSAVTADAGVEIDNITIDGTEIDLSSGDLTLDVAGRIILSADDNGEIRFQDGASLFGQIKDDDDRLRIESLISDADIMFVGNNGGLETTALTLDMSDSGSATFHNNVGIGVAPTHAFNLQSTGTVEARFRSTDGDMQLQISSDTDEGQDSILSFMSGTSGKGSIVYDHNPIATSQKMLFKVGDDAVTAMTISGSGQVGIGTTAPAYALDISGSVDDAIVRIKAPSGVAQLFLDSGANTNAGFQLREAGTAKWSIFNDGDASDKLTFEDDGDIRMTLDQSGNVGIGTSAPSIPLHIVQDPADTNQPSGSNNNVIGDGHTHLFLNGAGNAINEKIGLQFGHFHNHTIGGIFGVMDSTGGNTSGDITFDMRAATGDVLLTERMRITHEGNVGIGLTSPSAWHTDFRGIQLGLGGSGLAGGSTGNRNIAFCNNTYLSTAGSWKRTQEDYAGRIEGYDGTWHIAVTDTDTADSVISWTEAITVLNSGFVGINNTSPTEAPLAVLSSQGSWAQFTRNTHASVPHGIPIYYTNDPDNHSGKAYYLYSGTTERFMVENDGDVKNHDNSYGSISDERIKTDIRDSNSQWDDIKALRVRNFKRKDDVVKYGEDAKEMIGLVAQEAELVSPHLVKESTPAPFEIEHCGIPASGSTKTMMYSVLYMKSVKALQEAMTRIETLETQMTQISGSN